MSEEPGKCEVPRAADGCVFCRFPNSRMAWSSPLVMSVWDAFPVSPGHTLIIPRRHVAGWDELTADERSALFHGVDTVRAQIAESHSPDAYNVGFNDGPAAGQTVMHFHVHVIPRYAGDTDDPRGGVRWVLSEKADYWTGADE